MMEVRQSKSDQLIFDTKEFIILFSSVQAISHPNLYDEINEVIGSELSIPFIINIQQKTIVIQSESPSIL
jgi:hypothetical protein